MQTFSCKLGRSNFVFAKPRPHANFRRFQKLGVSEAGQMDLFYILGIDLVERSQKGSGIFEKG